MSRYNVDQSPLKRSSVATGSYNESPSKKTRGSLKDPKASNVGAPSYGLSEYNFQLDILSNGDRVNVVCISDYLHPKHSSSPVSVIDRLNEDALMQDICRGRERNDCVLSCKCLSPPRELFVGTTTGISLTQAVRIMFDDAYRLPSKEQFRYVTILTQSEYSTRAASNEYKMPLSQAESALHAATTSLAGVSITDKDHASKSDLSQRTSNTIHPSTSPNGSNGNPRSHSPRADRVGTKDNQKQARSAKEQAPDTEQTANYVEEIYGQLNAAEDKQVEVDAVDKEDVVEYVDTNHFGAQRHADQVLDAIQQDNDLPDDANDFINENMTSCGENQRVLERMSDEELNTVDEFLPGFNIRAELRKRSPSMRFDGIIPLLFAYQVVGVVFALLQHEKFYGSYIADEMGYGKTVEAFTTASWNLRIRINILDVLESWTRKDGKHLPKMAPGAGAPGQHCPSAGSRFHQCWCEPNGVTRRIAVKPGHTVAIVPPNLLSMWMEEFEASVSKTCNDPRLIMRLLVGHGSAPATSKSELAVGGRNQKTLSNPSVWDQSNFFILSSQMSYVPHVAKMIGNGGSSFRVSIMFIDEAHITPNETTGFATKILFGRKAPLPEPQKYEKDRYVVPGLPYLHFMSGTPFSGQPKDLIVPALYLWRSRSLARENRRNDFRSRVREEKGIHCLREDQLEFKSRIVHVNYTPAELDLIENSSPTRVRELQKQYESKCRELQKLSKEDFSTRGGDLLASLKDGAFKLLDGLRMWRRTSDTMFEGQPLINIPKMTKTMAPFTMSAQDIQRLDERQARLHNRLVDRLQKKQANSRGGTVTLNQWDIQGAHRDIRPYSNVPALVDLEKKKPNLRYTVEDLGKHQYLGSDAACDSPFKTHIDELTNGNPKFDQLFKHIHGQIKLSKDADEKWRHDYQISSDRLPRPAFRKTYICTFAPVVAQIILEFLHVKFPDYKQQIQMYYQKLSQSSRHKLIESFQSSSRKSPIVLVTTVGLSSLGINLTKADLAILFEPQLDPRQADQAFKRVERIGQKVESRGITYEWENSAFEQLTYKRSKIKEFIADVTAEAKAGSHAGEPIVLDD